MLKIDDLKEAINQLPIAYYLGKNISVDIDTQSPTSYINIQDLKIYISYNQILNDYNNNNNIIDTELLRRTLYHELSHAILTPKTMNNNDIINVFEDERIETINRNYFLKLDFKNLIYKRNNTTKEVIFNKKISQYSNAMELYFDIVRLDKPAIYNDGSINIDFQNYKKDIINMFNYIKYNSHDFDYYTNNINNFYGYVELLFNQHQENQNQENQHQENQNQDNQHQENQHQENQNQDNQQELEEEKNNEAMTQAIESLKSEVKNELLKKDKSTLLEDFKYVFKKITGNTFEGVSYSMNGSKFDTRKYINNINTIDRFKSFKKSGNQKTSIPSVHITFIQDASGSYYNNVNATRNIFKALQYACDNELYFLTFDIIVINNSDGIRLLKKENDFKFYAEGGGVIPNDMDKIIKSYNFKKADINLMIGLFDGRFFYPYRQNKEVKRYGYETSDGSGFSIFNNKNSIVISDNANEEKLKKYAPKAYINIVNTDYPTHLYNNILKSLERVIKQCSR